MPEGIGPLHRVAPVAGAARGLVLMLSAAHPPGDVRIVLKEGAALAEAGWAVRHLCAGPAEAPLAVAGVQIETYARAHGWWARLRGIPALARRAAAARPAVIQAHEPDSWLAALLARRRCGARVVLDVHEHYPSRLDARLPVALRPAARALLRALCRAVARAADAVVVAKDGLDADFPAARVVAVRNYAAPAGEAPRVHGPGPLTLVHLGAMAQSRGWRPLLAALALLPGVRLRLVGRFTDGSGPAFRARAAALGLAGRIEETGWLSQDQALAELAQGDVALVLFQPGVENHRLALPHKLFDAMLAGLPVIAPAFAEEVAAVLRAAGCGVLVDSADPRAIAAAVEALADPARRAALGAAGRAAALGEFGWAAQGQVLVGLHAALEVKK